MAGGAPAIASPAARVPARSASGRPLTDTLATWLLVSVALDLVVTRVVVRLAIFVPKGEPWASGSAVLGRVGAATDVLVPIVGVLLLAVLLAAAGRAGSGLERASLAGLAAVAAGGFALLVVPPNPAVATGLGLLVALVAAAAGIRAVLGGEAWPVRAGVLALACGIALPAAGRALESAGLASGGLPGLADAWLPRALAVSGQAAFVAGAVVLGLAGITSGRVTRGWALSGMAVGAAILASGLAAPAMLGAMAIWSVGVTGAVPGPVLALAAGTAVAGLPALHRASPAAATGAAIVLLAGFGLAASGLVLAGLLGLAIAGGGGPASRRGLASRRGEASRGEASRGDSPVAGPEAQSSAARG